MAGGLLNLVAVGNQNVYFNSDPTKSFFIPKKYAKYTNFGIQKIRVDHTGQHQLSTTSESVFKFKIPVNGDLLLDTYLVLNLPHIWSPICPPTVDASGNMTRPWTPYEFRWIRDIGTELIREIDISVGSSTIQKYTGKYIQMLVNRDYSTERKNLFNKMSGNVPELYDPANSGSRTNSYPNAFFTESTTGAEPSIRGRKLYIPISTWWTQNSKLAFPLVALQNNEMIITIRLRAVRNLFQIRDVRDPILPYIAPELNEPEFQMYRFLQTPPTVDILSQGAYADVRTNWNADIHLMCSYAYITKEEQALFAGKDLEYLVKQVYESSFENISGAANLKLENTSGMVSSWTFYLQRSDVGMRNEWSNYTNWAYRFLPYDVRRGGGFTSNSRVGVPVSSLIDYYPTGQSFVGPGMNPDGSATGLSITGDYNVENNKEILLNMAFKFDGSYREDSLDREIYEYVEKYTKSCGGVDGDGMYFYNFTLNTDPAEYQPSGALNLSKFREVKIELNTIVPQLSTNPEFEVICDPTTGQPVATNQATWRMYDYTFNLYVIEERYNFLTFVGGNCALRYNR